MSGTSATRVELLVGAAQQLLQEAPATPEKRQVTQNAITQALAAVRRHALTLENGATPNLVSANILGVVAYALGRLDVPLAFIERRIGEFGLKVNTLVQAPTSVLPTSPQ